MSNTLPTPVGTWGKTLLPSVLRTVVPLVYAMLVQKGVVAWIDPNDVFVTNFLTVVVTGAFYVLLRLLEKNWSKVGWLLGYAQQPVYVQGEVLAVTEETTPADTTITEVESSHGDDGVV